MRVMWAGIIGLLTIALLLADGLTTLQGAVVITGLPFAFVLCVMMVGLLKALRVEILKQESLGTNLPSQLPSRSHTEGPARNLAQRLQRVMSFPSSRQCRKFLVEVATPAMQEVQQALHDKAFKVDLAELTESYDDNLTLIVDLYDAQNFHYQLRPRKQLMPSFLLRTAKGSAQYYRVEALLAEGGQGYNLMDYSKAQLIEDVLDQFERHIYFLHSQHKKSSAETELSDEDNA
jgi:choline/glycine/proline betaine transport protein